MKKTYFGIPLDCENEHDAANLAARLFLCPRISTEHAVKYLVMLDDDSITIGKLLAKTDYEISCYRESLEMGDDMSVIMKNKAKEWKKVFASPTEEDFEYLQAKFGFSKDDLYTPPVKRRPVRIEIDDINSPKLMADYVKQFIKGQDDVIERLSVTFYHHYDSMKKKYTSHIKSPAILMGPTGCGKSEMLRIFAKACQCPIIRINTSELTPTGWKGMNLTDILSKEMEKYDDPFKLRYAVLVFHEFDKITHYGLDVNKRSGMVSDMDMIRDIMRLFEKEHPLNVETGKRYHSQYSELPTDNFLIIFDGAFYGIDEIVKKRLNVNKTIGFTNNSNNDNVNYQKLVVQDDLLEWGYTPELLGRIGDVIALNPLSTDVIYDILKTAKDNILDSHIDYCHQNNIDLRFSDDALRVVAEKAYKSGLGFRNVKTILSKALNNFYYEMIDNKNSRNRKVVEINKDYFIANY